jgi:hypothetical protein
MGKKIFFCIIIAIAVSTSTSCYCKKKEAIDSAEAIRIASTFAANDNFSIEQKDIEVLKIKKGFERGPIRFVWLMKYFSREDIEILLQKEFWIIFFYPKGLLDGNRILGGGFCALVDLYSGEVLFSFEDQ